MSIETIQYPKKVWLAAVDAATKLVNSPNLPANYREFYAAVVKAATEMEKKAGGGESGERDCSDPVFEAALRLCLSFNELQAKRIVALTAENDKLRLENKELWNRPWQTIPLSSTEPPKPLVTEQELGIRGPLKLGNWTNEFHDCLFDQDDKSVFVTSSSTYSDVRIKRATELLRIWNAAHHPTVDVVDTQPPPPAVKR